MTAVAGPVDAVGLVGLYIFVQLSRHKRVLRFANMELLDSVAPKRPNRWRHLPAILLVVSLLLMTVGLAGPTRDVRIPRNCFLNGHAYRIAVLLRAGVERYLPMLPQIIGWK
jgi:hypothetical protein